MKKKILIALLIILVGIQFIRPAPNNGEASGNKDFTNYVQVPEHIKTTLQASCFDCHSNHTNYPWYASVNPIGLWLNHHIEEGKSELNFSDFSTYDLKRMDHKLEETAEEVQEGHMPLPSYTLIHTDTKLSQEQVKQIVEWVKTERQRLNVPKQ
ncbi:heme-binding domain-containing protein [Rhodocytophaga rosea]|uniref:Heme-binding domain-containing protein n=1 Tax=Rhodocytophaga rosea TaxID=2704465 RepID=A0A6C0GG64_9BACT|nr:heme-binding domain-containing protein [Rhodocytophaga rosea]QHT66670.1 heme-binding domain-containing protein [Rhodocytophaga rosea]